MKSIIYLTDNSLDENLAQKVRSKLLEEARDIPIISVSQKPLNFGINVCVGEIGRSWMSLYTQILAGIEAVKTPYISICEHDCLYTYEHLSWIPTKDDVFFYNHNQWLVQWGGNHPELDGMYSYWPKRFALSQLVCHKDLLKQSTEEVMDLLKQGLRVERGLKWYGEPGLSSEKLQDYVKAANAATGGYPIQLQRYLKDYVTKYRSEVFCTNNPNLDIRHSSNFTGPKRGKQRTYILPYWGEFKKVFQ